MFNDVAFLAALFVAFWGGGAVLIEKCRKPVVLLWASFAVVRAPQSSQFSSKVLNFFHETVLAAATLIVPGHPYTKLLFFFLLFYLVKTETGSGLMRI